MGREDEEPSDDGDTDPPPLTRRRKKTIDPEDAPASVAELSRLAARVASLEQSRAALLGVDEGDAGRLGRLEHTVKAIARQSDSVERWRNGLKGQLVLVIALAGFAGTLLMHYIEARLSAPPAPAFAAPVLTPIPLPIQPSPQGATKP